MYRRRESKGTETLAEFSIPLFDSSWRLRSIGRCMNGGFVPVSG